MQELIKEIMAKFQGLSRAYGTYDLTRKRTKKTPGGLKTEGIPKTLQDNVTENVWRLHLEGIQGLGIVPINDNSMCYFGAIDIDVYEGLDLKKLLIEIYRQHLPLVPCRTKSGGIHLWCFVKEPIQASLMKEKLSIFAGLLGFGGSEIFPKQTEILAERGDTGQWINMPYYNYKDTDRYGYNRDGTSMTIEEFLKAIDNMWFSAIDFKAFTVNLVSDISDGPPCLQTLLSKGFYYGSRNDGLFAVGVYLKKSDPDNLEELLDEYNVKFVDPVVGSTEVASIIKSIKRKDYNYTCNKSPLKEYCNMQLCRTKRYGIGDMTGMPQLTGLTKFDSNPPVWFVDVDGGGRLELNTEDLQSQSKFQKKCMEGLNTMPPPIKTNIWQGIIQNLMENVNIIEAPSDASPRGLLFEYLERFCTSRAQARVRDEILLGKPWTYKERHHFRLLDFIAYLERMRFKEFKVNKISSMIREIGGEHKFFLIKGKGINTWSIPEFDRQNEEFDTPDINEEEIF